MRTFLPKAHYMPVPEGYRPCYRMFVESNWRLVPGVSAQATVGRAISVAEDYMAKQLNPPIRSERGTPDIGIGQWKSDREARLAEQQRADLQAFVVVERKKP